MLNLEAMATNEVETGALPSLSYWLEDVPRALFGGFNASAIRQLAARLDASYWEVTVQREHLLAELNRTQSLCEELEKREHELTAEVENLTGELESAKQEQKSLTEQLDCARSKWNSQLARARADIERELEQTQNELDAYRRREILLVEVAGSARRRAESVTSEARKEAELMLRHARKREAEITRKAEHELDRLEAERQRLQTIAAEFRRDVSASLLATIEAVNRRDGEEDAPEEAGSTRGEHSPVGRGDSETSQG
jgi:chromosome segregation ATPase